MANTFNAITSGTGGIATTGDASGAFSFTKDGGSAEVYIDASGNVGIGTSSPLSTAMLEVSRSTTVIPTATVTADAQVVGWRFRRTGGTYPREYYMGLRENSTAWDFYDNTADALRMRIDSSGNVLINTTSTGVASGGFLMNGGNGSDSYIGIGHSSSGLSGNYYAAFRFNGTPIGTITQNGTTAVAYNTSSDYRLKENVQPMVGALDKVALLKPVTYTWKSDGSDGEGFIAHELAEVCPHAVTGEKDAVDEEGNPQYQGIDTSFLVATLTAAIQELKAIIDTQAERISVLENKQ